MEVKLIPYFSKIAGGLKHWTVLMDITMFKDLWLRMSDDACFVFPASFYTSLLSLGLPESQEEATSGLTASLSSWVSLRRLNFE